MPMLANAPPSSAGVVATANTIMATALVTGCPEWQPVGKLPPETRRAGRRLRCQGPLLTATAEPEYRLIRVPEFCFAACAQAGWVVFRRVLPSGRVSDQPSPIETSGLQKSGTGCGPEATLHLSEQSHRSVRLQTPVCRSLRSGPAHMRSIPALKGFYLRSPIGRMPLPAGRTYPGSGGIR